MLTTVGLHDSAENFAELVVGGVASILLCTPGLVKLPAHLFIDFFMSQPLSVRSNFLCGLKCIYSVTVLVTAMDWVVKRSYYASLRYRIMMTDPPEHVSWSGSGFVLLHDSDVTREA